MKSNIFARIYNYFIDYFSTTSQLVSQQDAEANIREGVSFRGTNMLILILAIFIASLGLNTNSTAVIIGAMLISPLMGPIIGIGLGIGIHDFALLRRCLRNLLMAAGFSVIAATLYFMISPVNEQHSELLARTSPTIYDVLIAFFGGGAGIIALGSTNKGNVIPGVAIATALMPPLCTAGYGLATLQFNYFFGATYLFIINSIYIAFATFIGVKLMRYKGGNTGNDVRAQRVRKVVYTLAVLTMLPSIYLTYNMLRDSKFTSNADRFIAAECNWPGTQVLSRKAKIDKGQKELTITLIGRTLPIDSLKAALDPRLKFYGLAGTDLSFIQGGGDGVYNRAGTDSYSPSVDDVYRLAQATITRQQQAIDSLQAVIASKMEAGEAAPEVSPEIKVIFPEIKKIGISTTVFADPSGAARADTATVAIVSTNRRFGAQQRTRLARYLEARLGLRNVSVVEM